MSISDLFNLKYIKLKGSGHFCDVKQYRNNKTYKDYAVKILKKKHYLNNEYRYRLIKEIELLTKLSDCEQIIDLVESGENKEEEKLWYIMPYYEYNLFDFIKKNNKTLAISERFAILDQIINAIKFAHSKNILHRDISPNNIMVDRENISLVVKVSDFGLGKDKQSLSHYTRSSISGYGQILYVSPEQQDRLKDATVQSDIYSLGKLVYFIFTGKDPNNLRAFELSSLTAKAIEDNPQDRHKDIIEFEKHYLSLKELKFRIRPIDCITPKEFLESQGKMNWEQFHQIIIEGSSSDHVYYDYISPIISIFDTQNKILEYYKAVGSNLKDSIETFSDKIDECLKTTGWPFNATGSFGNFLRNLIININDSEVRLICFKQLWNLAFVNDQWAVQSSIKEVFNDRYISKEIELSFAEFISSKAIKLNSSHFRNHKIPIAIKNAIALSNDASEEEDNREKN